MLIFWTSEILNFLSRVKRGIKMQRLLYLTLNKHSSFPLLYYIHEIKSVQNFGWVKTLTGSIKYNRICSIKFFVAMEIGNHSNQTSIPSNGVKNFSFLIITFKIILKNEV